MEELFGELQRAVLETRSRLQLAGSLIVQERRNSGSGSSASNFFLHVHFSAFNARSFVCHALKLVRSLYADHLSQLIARHGQKSI